MYEISKQRRIFELGSLGLAVLIVAGITIPSFFNALKDVRGHECRNRLMLIAECLHELAVGKNIKPGERICSRFELNDLMLEKQDRAMHAVRLGAEPDCPDTGDFEVNLFLQEDGMIPFPKCTLGTEERNIEKHYHTLEGWEPAWKDEMLQRGRQLLEAAEKARKAEAEKATDRIDLSGEMNAEPKEGATP